MSNNKFYRNLGLRVVAYSVQKKEFVTDKLSVFPSDSTIKARMGNDYIDVYIGFLDTMPKDMYNIIVYVDELTLRDGSSTMVPILSESFVAPDVFSIERNNEVN